MQLYEAFWAFVNAG